QLYGDAAAVRALVDMNEEGGSPPLRRSVDIDLAFGTAKKIVVGKTKHCTLRRILGAITSGRSQSVIVIISKILFGWATQNFFLTSPATIKLLLLADLPQQR